MATSFPITPKGHHQGWGTAATNASVTTEGSANTGVLVRALLHTQIPVQGTGTCPRSDSQHGMLLALLKKDESRVSAASTMSSSMKLGYRKLLLLLRLGASGSRTERPFGSTSK